MSTIQFSDILAQAGKVDEKFKNASTSTDSEKIKTCEDVVSTSDKLVQAESSGKEKIVYLLLQGDALAYMAAGSQGDARKKSSDSALAAYMNASSLAIVDLEPFHPDRLRLALNYSTFLHNVAEEKDRAFHTAKSALDDARAELDIMGEQPHPDSTRLLELLHKRINEWVSADEDIVDDDE